MRETVFFMPSKEAFIRRIVYLDSKLYQMRQLHPRYDEDYPELYATPTVSHQDMLLTAIFTFAQLSEFLTFYTKESELTPYPGFKEDFSYQENGHLSIFGKEKKSLYSVTGLAAADGPEITGDIDDYLNKVISDSYSFVLSMGSLFVSISLNDLDCLKDYQLGTISEMPWEDIFLMFFEKKEV